MPVAIVTGAGSGIGRAVAEILAEDGYDVGVTTRTNKSGAEETCAAVRGLGRRAAMRIQDFEDPEGAADAIHALADALGSVEVLVNNAGVNRRQDSIAEDVATFRGVLDVNLTSAFSCARAAAQRMIELGQGGCIVNVSSVLAHAPLDRAAAYCASKAGLVLLTQVLALEWAAVGIRVNAVAPGHTITPMNFGDPDLRAADLPRPQIPVGRPAEAREIATAITFLASPGAGYVTGATLTVDGGLLLVGGPAQLEAGAVSSSRPGPGCTD